MSNIVLSLNKKEIIQVEKTFKKQQIASKSEYVSFSAKILEAKLNIYTSGKVVIQGNDAEVVENKINTLLKKKTTTPLKQTGTFTRYVGSDEVGVGDYFGPVVVASVYLNEDTEKLLKEIKVKDSKELTPEEIQKMYHLMKDKINYEYSICLPEHYNKLIDRKVNAHAIKAYLHNLTIAKIFKRLTNQNTKIVIDQFVNGSKYYEYLDKMKKSMPALKDMKVFEANFVEKAESKYLAVAAASIMARAIFVNRMNELSTKYKIAIPFGASDRVDAVAKQFIKKYGIEELKKNVKWHFANSERVN